MSERDFAMALAMLAEAFEVKDLTPVKIEAYHRGLANVPQPLINAAVRHLIETVRSDTFRRSKLPLVGDIRAAAEVCRKELLRAHPFSACTGCDATGWYEIEVGGVKRVRRCSCWKAWQASLASFGVTSEPLALPEAQREEIEL